MKKTHIIFTLLCVALLLILSCTTACDQAKTEETDAPCTTHTDADGDGLCDSCSAKVEPEEDVCTDHIDIDGDNLCELCGAEIAATRTFTLTVTDENGQPMQGITVILYHDIYDTVTEITDENGAVVADALEASYTLSFEGLADGWYIEGTGSTVTIAEDSLSFEFTAIDNNPDGSEEKPFFVGDSAVELTFAPGATYHYSSKGASKYLVVENENAKVTYDGEEYLPENGVIRLQIAETDTNSNTLFAVTNTSSSENTVSVRFEALEGSQGNPFTAQLDTVCLTSVPKENTHYFTWVATGSGFLVLTCETPNNNIMMYDITSYVVTVYTDGGKSVCLYVTEGDTVNIAVASKSAEDESEVAFELSLVSGSEDDPIPLYGTSSFRLPLDTEIFFVYRGEDCAVRIPETGCAISLNGSAVTAENGYHMLNVSEGSVISVTVTNAEQTEISMTVE